MKKATPKTEPKPQAAMKGPKPMNAAAPAKTAHPAAKNLGKWLHPATKK